MCIEKVFDNSCLKGKHRISSEKECTAPWFDVSGRFIVHVAASGLLYMNQICPYISKNGLQTT